MKIDIERLLADLNEPQRQAVTHTEGPVLVLAGAGSGKTRVLTYRIAYLIATGTASPWQILAMTFTNKAAQEMRQRVANLVPGAELPQWVGTFHSIFARILRREGDRLGYGRNFAIYDTEDQLSLIKTGISELRLQGNDINPRAVRSAISKAKNQLIFPGEYERKAESFFEREVVAPLYRYYQRMLKTNNAMDFDDLLIQPIVLFDRFPDVLARYQEQFRYILVDEYQDTNRAQYVLLKQLAQRYRNLCVVGDDDQSIYRWRGADVANILNFQEDFKDCAIYRLEQNYRSTKTILGAAHSVVRNNVNRWEKRLWTERGEGEKVGVVATDSDQEEAYRVVALIEQEVYQNKRSFKDFAVLYRTNAQSRILEQALRNAGIAYTIVGGVRFFERKEVKDVIAYLRVVCNPAESFSLKRIINFPMRGIGATTIAKLEQFARERQIPLFAALERVDEIPNIASRTKNAIKEFVKLINKYRSLCSELSPAELATALVEEIGLRRMLKEEGTDEARDRLNNIDELLYAIASHSANAEDPSLEGFLQHVSLLTDVDSWDDRANVVTLMTLHSAKGLEFPVVFITGLEEGLFPLANSAMDQRDLEEERRLFYVGATRAKEKLYLTWAASRRRWGLEERVSRPSRFLMEIGSEYVELLGERDRPRQPRWEKRTQRPRSQRSPMPAWEDESQETNPIYAGRRVHHPKFGHGTVIAIDGADERARVVVLFDAVGEKTLVLRYANLRPV
ncbi:MAG TPA: hypothetical protein ENK07_07330 [Bacteroidetes bacterium]|nr:hypothetical protein [Bacteroidota bacterium]